MLFLIGRFGMDGGQYQAVEYRGPAIRALSMQERMTLSNMTAELGGQTGLIASDSVTEEFLKKKIEIWDSDAGAPMLAHHRFDAGQLAPQVAAPHSPANTRAVSEFKEKVDLAYIGACTGAELLANSCGMCAGYGEHLLPDGAVAISTTARNFRGRMGSASAQVYLASPYTVAASAVAGRIADPRELLS
jgi:3-isopropylmalate/(R)-2-methylmalate dehydratase large subunit